MPRDSYAEVGAALRAACAAAARAGLTQRQHRVFLAVASHTAGWSRLSDAFAVSQIEEVTGLDRRHVRRALADLAALGLIVYQPGSSPKGGPRRSSVVGLPSPTDQGPGESPSSTHADQGPEESPGASATRGRNGQGTRGRERSGPGAAVGPPSEVSREETPDEGARERAQSAAPPAGTSSSTEEGQEQPDGAFEHRPDRDRFRVADRLRDDFGLTPVQRTRLLTWAERHLRHDGQSAIAELDRLLDLVPDDWQIVLDGTPRLEPNSEGAAP